MRSTAFRAFAAGASVAVLASPSHAELVYGTTLQGMLLNWDSATPGAVGGVAIQGLQANESIIGIDFRPQDGLLYGLGSFSRIYTINPGTGQATFFTGDGAGGAMSTTLNGSAFGFDFNPAANRLRVVGNGDQNLRLNPTVSPFTTTVDGTLAYAAGDPNVGANPDVTHGAYTNNFAGAPSTVLYGLDTDRDVLVIQNPPNNGTLNTVGPVGADITDLGGFDISGLTGIAYAAVKDANLSRSTFWTINLATGAGTAVGEIDGGVIISSMTVAIPEPATAGIGIAASVLVLRRRRS